MNRRCKVITTTHSGIMPGDEGEILHQFAEGYCVRILTAQRNICGGKDTKVEAEVYFPSEHIEIIPIDILQ